ncbi:hypothetical protein Ancab_006926 [Ancistrocladus abbreviatus]
MPACINVTSEIQFEVGGSHPADYSKNRRCRIHSLALSYCTGRTVHGPKSLVLTLAVYEFIFPSTSSLRLTKP